MDCASRVRDPAFLVLPRVHATREIETLSLLLFLSLRSPNAASPRNVLRLTRANAEERRRRVWSVVERRIFAVHGFFCRPSDGCCFLEGVYYTVELLPRIWYGKIFRYDDPVKRFILFLFLFFFYQEE